MRPVDLPNRRSCTYIPVDVDRGTFLSPGSLVYVHKSKKKNSAQRKAFAKARVVSDPGDGDCGGDSANRRVVVRYPKGSTYSAKRTMLSPILEQRVKDPAWINSNRSRWIVSEGRCTMLCLCCGETDEYRRLCTHSVTEADTFLEIGCDFGFCIDAVLKSMQIPEPAHDVDFGDDHAGETEGDFAKRIVGVDISVESIAIAKESHAGMSLHVIDALSEEGMSSLRDRCTETLGGTPTVVAIDINGIRELEAVVQCIANVTTLNPRVIIVKSRHLKSFLLK